MPWILFFFLGGAVAISASASKKPKSRFSDSNREVTISEIRRQVLLDPSFRAGLISGAPYRLIDVVAMASRLIDYSLEYGKLPPQESPSFKDQDSKKSWSAEQYLGNLLVAMRRKVALYSGISAEKTAWSYSSPLKFDEQTRVRAILFEVCLPILAGQIEIGPHPSLQGGVGILGGSGNVGPVGSDRPIWFPWSPLRAYVNKDVPGGTLAQQDFIRSAVTWLVGYFLQPSTACYWADEKGNQVFFNKGQDRFSFPSQYQGWKKGTPGWRYSRDPVVQSGMLFDLFCYFRSYLYLFCKNTADAKPSPCDAVAAFNAQIVQLQSREEEARFRDEAGKLQVYAEDNLQRMDLIGNLAVANFLPREVKPFDWSVVIRVVLTAVAITVQVVPGIGQAVGAGIAAAIAVTNAAIGFVKAAQEGGEQAANLAYGFATGIIDVLQRASLLTKKDIDTATKIVNEARKAAGLAQSTVDQIQQGNLGGAYAIGGAAVEAGKETAQAAKETLAKVKGTML
jgi:hypothetical protein